MKVKSIFYKPLLLLAHPARFERATLSTAILWNWCLV